MEDDAFSTGTSAVPFTDSSGGASAAGSIATNSSSSLGSAFSVGGGVSAVAALTGMALSIYGSLQAAKTQKAESQLSMQIGAEESQINQRKYDLSQLIFQRQNTENERQLRRKLAINRAAAANQGAQFGSGAAGGRAQDVASAAYNTQNLAEGFQIDTDIFNTTQDIGRKQIQMAQLGGNVSTYAGYSAIGQGLTSSSMALGRLSGGFGGTY